MTIASRWGRALRFGIHSITQPRALPGGAEVVLTVLRRRDHPLGTGDIIAATGRSLPWVRAQLEEMRTSGVVRWEGKSPRDPRATWSFP